MVFIERTHTTQWDTSDPTILYSTDMRATLKTHLTKKYVGKCFKRCYIVDIIDIVKYSPPVLESMRNGGSARIAVQFRIRGVIYDRFEVIPDAKIVEVTESGKLILRSKYASISVAANVKLQPFRVGMTIPVRAYDCGYVPYRDTVSVTAIPFAPKVAPTQTFDVVLSQDDQAQLEPQIARVKELATQFAAHPDHAKWRDFLDPKNKEGDRPPLDGFKHVELTAVHGSGQIVRPEWSPVGDTRVWWRTAEKRDIKNSVSVLRGYLNSMIKQLELANILATQYDWSTESKSAWVTLYTDAK